jgi:cytochrome c oxidase subunit 4
MNYGLLNLGSLLLGIKAWLLPVINLAKHNKSEHKNWHILAIISIFACAVSLYFQIIYHNYLVNKEDWSALMDTSDPVLLVSSMLIVVTLILNVITIIRYTKNGKK